MGGVWPIPEVLSRYFSCPFIAKYLAFFFLVVLISLRATPSLFETLNVLFFWSNCRLSKSLFFVVVAVVLFCFFPILTINLVKSS
jgi:hypothetical protein